MLPPSRTGKYKTYLGGISMPRKSKIDSTLKISLVESYFRNEISCTEATRQAGFKSRASFSGVKVPPADCSTGGTSPFDFLLSY
ncbi:hypothetical protein GCWU000246_00934 [Jonquetella anthropi E3_33 E1]|nr:hypothetical protein GCWU000246_00934 [Jonquetella anthropi E3_33 E1]